MELSSLSGSAPARSLPVPADAKAAPADTKAAAPLAPTRVTEPAPAPPAAPEPSAEQLQQAVKNINTALQVKSQDLEFSVDTDSARLVVTVTDKTTHEVIRQMPSKEALEIAKAIDHLQSLLIRQTA
ncbi:MAG: flagellar protein FlaG [Massilia sp.]